MLTTRTFVIALACTLIVAMSIARPAFAQRANGPYAGVLGGAPDGDRTQGLDLQGSTYGAWDKNQFPASEATTLDPRVKDSGISAGAAGSLTYDRRGERMQFALSGGANARVYAAGSDPVTAYQASTMWTTTLSRKVKFNAGAAASYSPFFQFAPFLDGGLPSAGSLAGSFGSPALAERTLGGDASVGLAAEMTRRTGVSVTASGHEWRLLDAPQNNLRTWGGNVSVHHKLTRSLGVHVGYGRDRNEYADQAIAPYVNETIDAGVDYGDTLAFARRASLSFSTSTEAIRYTGQTHYRVNGDVRLTRGFGRSWSTWLGYDRNAEFRIGFRAPLLTDSVTTGIAGQATRRLKWSTDAGYTHGVIGFDGSAFSAYIGTTRADLALTRTLAVFGQYGFYHYQLPPGSSALDLLSRFSRQVAMVGLSVWVPLIHDARPPRESN